jgi:hypothetical protein
LFQDLVIGNYIAKGVAISIQNKIQVQTTSPSSLQGLHGASPESFLPPLDSGDALSSRRNIPTPSQSTLNNLIVNEIVFYSDATQVAALQTMITRLQGNF